MAMTEEAHVVADLLSIIKRVVQAAGGKVVNIMQGSNGHIFVSLSGLPEGPLSEEQQRAARWLEGIGIKCR